jgi:hypothetical protein
MPRKKTAYWIESGVKLTRKKAIEWLESSKLNRDVRQNIVDRYADVMFAGKWFAQNGQTIGFDVNGELRDGQHRCWGIVVAQDRENELAKRKKRRPRQLSVVVDVAHNIDTDAVRSVDTGTKRTGSDTLTMQTRVEGTSISGAKEISVALRIVKAFEKGNIYVMQKKITNDEMWDLFKMHPGVEEAAADLKGYRFLITKGIMVAMYYILHSVKAHRPLVKEFFHSFATGENLTHGSPILALRNKCISAKTAGKDRLTQTFYLSCFIKSWNAFILKKKMSHMAFTPNSLPTIRKQRTIHSIHKKAA